MAVSSGIAERVDQLFELSSTSARRFARPGPLAGHNRPARNVSRRNSRTEPKGVFSPALLRYSRPGFHRRQIRPAVNKKGSPVRQFAQARTNTPSASTLETPWSKWLNEDVAYIITDQERQTFKALQTDQERESFVEEFWLRRDPTPGTVENEFKEEHYRRIAYANDHFTSTVPGLENGSRPYLYHLWSTRRSRVTSLRRNL